jgi:predicted TIM-barrel fold metal-dependent hydrolase
MTRSDEPTFNYTKGVKMDEHGKPASDPMQDWFFRFCGDAACAPIQMAFAGVFDRFPNLQIYWGETMAGWIKYALFQIDDHYERYRYMAEGQYGLDSLERMPSEYLRDNNMWGFLYDPVGVADRAAVGADKLMWGSDFPHLASDWPDSVRTLERNFAGVPEDERYLMVAGNAIRFFHLEDYALVPSPLAGKG